MQLCKTVQVTFNKNAFDWLSHPVTKFLAYGMDTDATTLLTDYLTNRSQRVKLNKSVKSSWNQLSKGVP